MVAKVGWAVLRAHGGKRVEPFADRTVADAVHVDLEAGGVEAQRDLGECRRGPVRRAAVVAPLVRFEQRRRAPLNLPIEEDLGAAGGEATGGETLA